MREVFTTPERMGDDVMRLFRELADAKAQAIPAAMFMAAQMARTEAVLQIGLVEPHVPVDTGQLRRSYEVIKTRDGAVLQNTAEHAVFMEFGTRPHFAPRAPIEAWVRRKLRGMGRPGGGKQGPVQRVGKQTRERAVKSMTRAVLRKIAREGTEPRRFHAKAAQRFPEFVAHALLWELNKLAASNIGGLT